MRRRADTTVSKTAPAAPTSVVAVASDDPFAPPTRRRFLRDSLLLGSGLVIGFHWSGRRLLAAEGTMAASEGVSAFAPNAFVRIGSDDSVTILSKHIEFGQGSYTGLATILAEELDADWGRVRVEAAPSDATRYNNLLFGPVQGTGGSTAMANSWQQLRQAGATARAMLVAAAAEAWGVPAGEIEVASGVLSHRSGRTARFGELATAAAQLEPPSEVALKEPKDFTLIGSMALRRVDVAGKTNGSAKYTLDHAPQGVLTALIARPPRFGGKVKSFDDKMARKVKGVVEVVEVPNGVAVLANSFWAASKGRRALEVVWDESAAETRGSDELVAEYQKLAAIPGRVVRDDGSADPAIEGASRTFEAEYIFPYLAHAPMEPLDCVIQLGEGGCDVWAGSQIQTIDQAVVAGNLGLEPAQVRIHTQLGGGSFGRRATPNGDVAGEAASIVRATGSKAPIKLVWTREDDVRGGRYRPLYVHRLRAGLDAEGRIVGWHHRIVGQSILTGTAFEAALVKDGIDHTSIEGAVNLPYAIPNLRVELHTTQVGVPVLWWRSVGHTHTAYATETFLDELAAAAGRDPVELRRELLAEHPRHRAVLELAAEKAGWGSPLPEGRARGVAVHESFGSFVAQVAEVSEGADGLPKVHRVVCAVDCGIAINPHNIEAQVTGGLGYGLGAVLHGEITLDAGQVVESNFHDYPSLRMPEMPRVEVHVVPSAEAPSGVGEPGTPPIGPAVANAWRQLTGTSLRRLPFRRALAHEVLG